MVPRSPLLLIVGMHHSGTSLLGKLLPVCGIATSTPKVGDEITALQEQLLIDLDRWWPSPRGMKPLPDRWLASARGQRALDELISLLQEEQERQTGPWAISDPRSSLLLPLWQTACTKLQIPLQLVLAVRDPADVMLSLVESHQATTGMDGWRAQRLWWRFNSDVLRQGCDLPLQVISYERWFDPAKSLQQLRSLGASQSSSDLRVILANTLKPSDKPSRRAARHCGPTAQVRQFHQWLQTLALQPAQRAKALHWLEQQDAPSALAPLPRKRSELKRRVNTWRGRPPQNHVATHPWGYLAEIVCGGQGPAADHLLQAWLQHGFRKFELERFAALAGSKPDAEPWQADQPAVQLQVRGGDLNTWPTHTWLQHCPITGHGSIRAVPYGTAGASPILINLADLQLQEGPEGGKELERLTQFQRIWDPDPQRVQVLRQFGVKASCLKPEQPLKRFPQPTPEAEPWQADQTAVQLQVRGGDLNTWPTHAWLQHCPIKEHDSITAVPYGTAGPPPY